MERSIRGFGVGRPFASRRCRRGVLALGFGVVSALGVAPVQATLCGGVNYPFPFTDVSGVGAPFCPGIMEAYVTGISRGTTPTTFSPNDTVPRLQMTTFLQRTLDQTLARGSHRAALNRWWTPQTTNTMQAIAVGGFPVSCAADGESIWTTNQGEVLQVQASTGKILGTWTGASASSGVVTTDGRIYVTGELSPGSLYVIDPTQAPAVVTTAASTLGAFPSGIAFDGTRLWTANLGPPGSVSIITPQATTPYPVTTVTVGFTQPTGILYDGANIWVTDFAANKLFKLDAGGAILQTIAVSNNPQLPVFDGANIWVPNENASSITVVQASTGNVVATIFADANNHLNGPYVASFDGERVLVVNFADTVTVFKAADLSFVANVPIGTSTFPSGACSDGVNFFVDLNNTGTLLRF